MFRSFVLAFLIAFSFSSFNNLSFAQLISSYTKEQSGSLPQGRFLFSFLSLSGNADHLYNQAGSLTKISDNFEQNLSFEKIANEDLVRTNQIEGLFLSNQVDLKSSAGALRGESYGSLTGKVPVIGYGISNHTGIYLAAPIINFQFKTGYKFEKSQAMEDFLKNLRDYDQNSSANEFEQALNSSLEYKLNQAGYVWQNEYERSYLGDLELNVVRTLKQDLFYRNQIQGIVILPTAKETDLSQLFPLKAGERRLGLGLKYLEQYQISSPISLLYSLTGRYLFSTTQARRIPKSSEDELFEVIDNSATISDGASYKLQIQAVYEFNKLFSIYAGTIWNQKFDDSISGNKVATEFYQKASQKTGSSILSTYLAANLNTIQSFLDQKFYFPAQFELGLGFPLAGKNAIAEPLLQFQASLFF